MQVDTDDDRWAAQIGPALNEADTARLLDLSPEEVRRAPDLLQLHNRDGRPVYPVFQFAGRAPLLGVGEVVTTLTPALQPLAVAAWLTGPNRVLGGRRPADLLRDGDSGRVLELARQLADSARA
ncbi:antitoxin Xre/MbcA/ParS toxin-binding domain-containing protein [Geodermatophilus sp. SYSU D00684]